MVTTGPETPEPRALTSPPTTGEDVGPAPILVMGILNVTPDSFSDGGRYLHPDAALAHGLDMVAQGATIVDVGGESSRPGCQRPPADVELTRVVPAVRALVAAGVTISVDTMRAQVAEGALDAGAHYINDVSGGLVDPDMLRVVAERGVPYILMHWRGHGAAMQDLATYDDVVAEVRDELAVRVDAALAAGIAAESIILDPGIGFAKTAEHNWEVLGRLGEIVAMGFPVLMGASRKMFLGPMATPPGWPGAVVAEPADESVGAARFVPEDAPPTSRDVATATVTALSAIAGAWAVRVHDVPSSVAAAKVVAAAAQAGRVAGRAKGNMPWRT
ncbi:MAG: dihydropteroate synthase [Dermatophilaceae bacterium]